MTIGLGICFLGLQLYDYSQLGFGLKDGVFGTLFYVMTGIHMAHVVGGVVFLDPRLRSGQRGRLSATHHDPLAAGAIYWDFVDVVWTVPVHGLLPADPEVTREHALPDLLWPGLFLAVAGGVYGVTSHEPAGTTLLLVGPAHVLVPRPWSRGRWRDMEDGATLEEGTEIHVGRRSGRSGSRSPA